MNTLQKSVDVLMFRTKVRVLPRCFEQQLPPGDFRAGVWVFYREMNVRYVQHFAKQAHTMLIKPIAARESALFPSDYQSCGDFHAMAHVCLQVSSLPLPSFPKPLYSNVPVHFFFTFILPRDAEFLFIWCFHFR